MAPRYRKAFPPPRVMLAAIRPKTDDLPEPYSLELVERVCARMSAGEPLSVILAEPDMPGWGQFWYWITRNEEASRAYDEARERLAHSCAHFILGIMHDVAAPDGIAPTRARAALEAAQWVAARMSPKHYSDKDKGNTGISVTINTNLALDGDRQGDQDESATISGTYTIVADPDEGRAHADDGTSRLNDNGEDGGGGPPDGSHRRTRRRRGTRSVSQGSKNSKKIENSSDREES